MGLTGQGFRAYCYYMNKNLHAHVSTASADCDGPMYRNYVEVFNDAEIAETEAAQGVNDFSDIHFMQRVMMNVASPYAVHQMTVKVDEQGIEVSEQTEEGYRNASVVWCRDECDTEFHSQRDVYAEAMNY